MKPATTLRASLAAIALLALSATSASAVGGSFRIGTEPGTTEADCTNAGGTVVTDGNGNKVCKPKPTQSREPTN